MELVAGFLLSVVIVLAGILHSKNTNESVTVEKEDKVKKTYSKKRRLLIFQTGCLWMLIE